MVDKDNLVEVLKVLDELKAKYTQPKNRKNEVILTMESVSSFMLYVGKVLDKSEKFEFSIIGKKVETAKKRKSA